MEFSLFGRKFGGKKEEPEDSDVEDEGVFGETPGWPELMEGEMPTEEVLPSTYVRRDFAEPIERGDVVEGEFSYVDEEVGDRPKMRKTMEGIQRGAEKERKRVEKAEAEALREGERIRKAEAKSAGVYAEAQTEAQELKREAELAALKRRAKLLGKSEGLSEVDLVRAFNREVREIMRAAAEKKTRPEDTALLRELSSQARIYGVDEDILDEVITLRKSVVRQRSIPTQIIKGTAAAARGTPKYGAEVFKRAGRIGREMTEAQKVSSRFGVRPEAGTMGASILDPRAGMGPFTVPGAGVEAARAPFGTPSGGAVDYVFGGIGKRPMKIGPSGTQQLPRSSTAQSLFSVAPLSDITGVGSPRRRRNV